LVDVFHQLRLQLIHGSQPPQSESAELTAEHRRVSEIAAVLRLELVDEHRERRAVMELEAAHLKRHPRETRKLGRSPIAANPLHAAVQRRQNTRKAVDRPDAVELTHAQ